MFIRWREPKSLLQLRTVPLPIGQLRPHFRVAVIDDEPLLMVEGLRASSFNIVEIGDPRDISAVAEYPIILCDITNVGTHFRSALGGALVISEIKRHYPAKYVIGYSGGAFGPDFQRHLNTADAFIRRGAPQEDWAAVIDRALRTMGDPVESWKRVRRILLEQDLSTFDVFLVEEAFVEAIEKKREFDLQAALRNVKRDRRTIETIEKAGEGLVTVAKLVAGAIS